jgi:hypothetical protein
LRRCVSILCKVKKEYLNLSIPSLPNESTTSAVGLGSRGTCD